MLAGMQIKQFQRSWHKRLAKRNMNYKFEAVVETEYGIR